MKNKNNKYIALAATLCAVCITIMIITLSLPKKAPQGNFIPPPFDGSAVKGEPSIPDGLGYAEPYREGMGFCAGLCGNIIIKDNTADIYFTNKAENEVWLMLRITDENGALLAETGIVRPGEFIQSIQFKESPKNGQKVICKIMAYEPETYYSKGYFTLKTTVRYE